MSDEILENQTEEKVVTDNDEIRELGKEVLGKLDSPLVVHKKSDACYEDTAAAYEMNETHTDEERPTLVRHRFRKEKKSKKGVGVIFFFVLVFCAIFAALYITGNITFGSKDDTTKVTSTTQETTTSVEENYKGTIVVKDTYIFVDGVEVNGIQGLQNALKYEDPEQTKYKIIDEHANSDFLNGNVLRILESMKFFTSETEIVHIESTGLVAAAELTTLPPETTTKKSKKKAKSKNSSKKKSAKSNN